MNKDDLSTCQEETYGKWKHPAHAGALSFVARGESLECACAAKALCDPYRCGVADTVAEFMSEKYLGLLKPNYLSQIPKQERIIKI